MLHIIAQSRNNTRKFYNEETWPTNWNMQPIFFLRVTDNTQVCSTGCYVCGPVWDFWILASACHSLTMWSWSSPTTPLTKGGEGMAQMLSALLFYVSWNDPKVSFQTWDSMNHFQTWVSIEHHSAGRNWVQFWEQNNWKMRPSSQGGTRA